MENEELLIVLEVGYDPYKEEYGSLNFFSRHPKDLQKLLLNWKQKIKKQVDHFTCCRIQVFRAEVDESGNISSLVPYGIYKYNSLKPFPRIINKPNVSNQSSIKEENKAQLPPQSSPPNQWYIYTDEQGTVNLDF